MAIARIGTLIGAISGNVGSLNFTNSRRGLLVKSAVMRTKNPSIIQLTRRAALQRIAHAWDQLSATEITEWNTLGSQHSRPNRFGIPIRYSGRELFFKLNITNLMTGEPMRTARIPFLIHTAQYLNTAAFTAAGAYNVTYNSPGLGGGSDVAVYGCRPISDRISEPFRSWRYLHNFFILDSPHDVSAEWDPILGAPAAGEVVGVRCRGFAPGYAFGPPFDIRLTVS